MHSFGDIIFNVLLIQILSVSAFDKTPIRDLLTITQVNQNVKELQYNLFDNMF